MVPNSSRRIRRDRVNGAHPGRGPRHPRPRGRPGGSGKPHRSAKFLQTYDEPPLERIGEAFPEVVHALVAADHLTDLDIDVVHDHSLAGPLTSSWRRKPTVVTAHGPIAGELAICYRVLSRHTGLVAISDGQRARGPDLAWEGRVYNAIPVDDYPFQDQKENFCLFLGRISPEKAPDLAIKAAREAGYPIVVAAKCFDVADMAEGYETIYRRMLEQAGSGGPA